MERIVDYFIGSGTDFDFFCLKTGSGTESKLNISAKILDKFAWAFSHLKRIFVGNLFSENCFCFKINVFVSETKQHCAILKKL